MKKVQATESNCWEVVIIFCDTEGDCWMLQPAKSPSEIVTAAGYSAIFVKQN
jgi:hypothetical protein